MPFPRSYKHKLLRAATAMPQALLLPSDSDAPGISKARAGGPGRTIAPRALSRSKERKDSRFRRLFGTRRLPLPSSFTPACPPSRTQVQIDANGVLKLQHLLHITRAPGGGGGAWGGCGAAPAAVPGMSGRDFSAFSSGNDDTNSRGVRGGVRLPGCSTPPGRLLAAGACPFAGPWRELRRTAAPPSCAGIRERVGDHRPGNVCALP